MVPRIVARRIAQGGVRAGAAQVCVSSEPGEHMLKVEGIDHADLRRILNATGRAPAAARGGAVVVASLSQLDVIWAAPAAHQALRADNLAALGRVLFDAPTSRGMLGRLRRLSPDRSDQLERLSIVSPFSIDLATLAIRVFDHETLGRLLVIEVAGAPPVLAERGQGDEIEVSLQPIDAPSRTRSLEETVPELAVLPSLDQDEAGSRSLAEVTAALAQLGGAGHRFRFLFELDPDNHVTRIDTALISLLGATVPRVGDDFEASLKAFAPEAATQLRQALVQRCSVSGIEVDWPIDRSDAVVAVTLGGAPLRGGQAGFRGFGVVHVDQVTAAPPARNTGANEPEAAPVVESGPAPLESTLTDEDAWRIDAQDLSPGDQGEAAQDRPSPISVAKAFVPPPAELSRHPEMPQEAANRSEANVVHLARFKPSAPVTPAPPHGGASQPRGGREEALEEIPLPDEPQWAESPRNETVAEGRLSTTEQSAFKEIARALGVRELQDELRNGDLRGGEARGDQGKNTASEEPAPPQESESIVADSNNLVVLDRLPVPVVVLRDKRLLFANNWACELVGVPDRAGLERSEGLRTLIEAATRSGSSGALDRLVLSRTWGEPVAVDGKITSLPWQGGSPAQLIVLQRVADAGVEKRTAADQDQLRAECAAKDISDALDVAASGMAVLDPAGRILSLNPAAERLFGVQAHEVIGETCAILYETAEQPAWSTFIAPFITAGLEPGRIERRRFVGRSRAGEARPLGVSVKLLDDRRVLVVWQAWQDRRSDELEAARDEAERTSSLKSEFLAKVSHEIRTPVNAIIGFAEVMMEERLGPVTNERYKEYLRDIHGAGTHVMSLVNDLLDLSRIEAGRLDLKLVSVNANAVVSECVGTLQNQAHRERVILRQSLASRLPLALADERALRQIVLNLLSNAVKFNEPGGQVIVSTAAIENGGVAIRVRDTGLGMSEQDIAVAMEPFRQLSTPKASAGSGLGLPLTKALVEANQAIMVIKSRPKEGTLVEVVFQRAPAEAMSVPAE